LNFTGFLSVTEGTVNVKVDKQQNKRKVTQTFSFVHPKMTDFTINKLSAASQSGQKTIFLIF